MLFLSIYDGCLNMNYLSKYIIKTILLTILFNSNPNSFYYQLKYQRYDSVNLILIRVFSYHTYLYDIDIYVRNYLLFHSLKYSMLEDYLYTFKSLTKQN